MFYDIQAKEVIEKYDHLLVMAGSLSNLFSDSRIPYLYYRLAERLFCKAFKAEDLSRSDVSVDAKKDNLGIGLKTFLIGNSRSFQKVAEFNRDRELYFNLDGENLARKVSELRNKRIDFTSNAFGINKMIYHSVVRSDGKFLLHEEEMHKVDIDSIRKVKRNSGSLFFEDGKNEYSFLTSKSTLTKRFNTEKPIKTIEIDIIDDPLTELSKLIISLSKSAKPFQTRIVSTAFLPLYQSNYKVCEKSGLNQWNAGGRNRDPNEVYIPIPKRFNMNNPEFFPSRESPFIIILPDGRKMKSKVCQDNDKALMSDPNKMLGKWILREVLKFPERRILSYYDLMEIGIDSIRIDKIVDGTYELNFAKIGSYEAFSARYLK
jgi:hypothetical protein